MADNIIDRLLAATPGYNPDRTDGDLGLPELTDLSHLYTFNNRQELHYVAHSGMRDERGLPMFDNMTGIPVGRLSEVFTPGHGRSAFALPPVTSEDDNMERRRGVRRLPNPSSLTLDMEGPSYQRYDETVFVNPKIYEVDPEQIKNTMDMIKVFRAMVERITIDESTVKKFGIEQYVKEK